MALFDELAARGFARTSMESVARRAGVGKAALYRRWPSKDAMVLGLIESTVRSTLVPIPDTGRLETDLRAMLTGLRAQLGQPLIALIAPGLLAEAAGDGHFWQSLWATVAEPRRAVIVAMLSAAVERGELSGNFEMELGIDLLIAPLALRMLVLHRPVDDRYFEAMLSSLSAALHAASAT